MNLKKLGIKELLQLQATVTEELKSRNVVRTKNNPLGDYTEWLVGNALGIDLQANSKNGFDGIRKSNLNKIQIKGRRITPENKSRQLSAIRKYEDKDFDELAAVIFNEHFEVIDAVLIPHEVVGKYASYRKHLNAHTLILKGPILNDSGVKSIKDELQKFEKTLIHSS